MEKFTATEGGFEITADSYTYNKVTYTNLVNAVIAPSGEIISAGQINMPNGANGIDVSNPDASGNSYTIDNAGTLQQGPIVITNGQNIVYQNGCLSASSADSLVHTDTVATQLQDLSLCSNTLDVQSADSVWAGCVYMEGVENSSITAAQKININSDQGANFSIKDCASNQISFDALSNNASVTITRETVSPTYNLNDSQITLTKNDVTETVSTNNTAQVEVHRDNGIEKVVMTPVTLYVYDAKDPLKDFSFRAWQDIHTLYLKKVASQSLPAETATCKDCSIIDLANHRIDIRGIIDFNKAQVNRMGKNAGLFPFFTTASKAAKALLTLDADNAIINELTILTDAPPYKTFISNYLALSEAIQTNGRTERLLTINEKITKDALSTSLLKSYKTVYSNSSTLIDSNVLTYQREGTTITVLPDGNVQIADILNKLKDKRAFLLLPALFLPFFFRKRGQLTLFILIGVLIMLIIGIMLYTVGIVSLPSERIHVTEKQQVQDYVTQCLAMAGKSALDVFGVQGGFIALQPPFFTAQNTAYLFEYGRNAVLPLERAELDLAEEAKHRVLACINDFKVLSGVTVDVQRSPNLAAKLASRDAVFTMSYPFQVNKQNERWDFADFGVTLDIPVYADYLAANATVQSQVQNDGQINLDELPAVKMTLFPYQKTLLAFIESFAGKQLDPYYFFFANAR
ncbi:MAG TPA: hypothetical protein VLJ21_00335 [Candidatus Binatia bacterium]|nr:hypothetical protein [Candidatus Binatia bacterium]